MTTATTLELFMIESLSTGWDWAVRANWTSEIVIWAIFIFMLIVGEPDCCLPKLTWRSRRHISCTVLLPMHSSSPPVETFYKQYLETVPWLTTLKTLQERPMLPSIKSLRSLVILIVSAFASWLSFPVFCLTTAIFVVLVSLLSVVPGTGEQAQHSIPQTGALLPFFFL